MKTFSGSHIRDPVRRFGSDPLIKRDDGGIFSIGQSEFPIFDSQTRFHIQSIRSDQLSKTQTRLYRVGFAQKRVDMFLNSGDQSTARYNFSCFPALENLSPTVSHDDILSIFEVRSDLRGSRSI
jgi:hypothetical protein